VNPEIPRNDDDDDDDADDVKEIHCPLPRLLVQENRSVHFLTIFRTVSFMLPMAFWILQRCAPPCRQTVTWHRRPPGSFVDRAFGLFRGSRYPILAYDQFLLL